MKRKIKLKNKPKLIVILGQTATGKSSLAIHLAELYNGEVISADSRQVYTGLDIGTGKVTQKEMRGIPHHLLDVISPKKVFSVAEWKERADNAIADIISRGKVPIICGGTGFYIQSIVDNIVLPDVPPNPTLRARLEKKNPPQLFAMLQKLDPRRAKNIEQHNPTRLVRAIEIAMTLGAVPRFTKKKNPYDIVQIGLTMSDAELQEKIKARLISRLRDGMVAEVKKLHDRGLSWKRMHSLGLEYRYLALYVQKKISRAELIEKLDREIRDYARRQYQWFKRDERINWYHPRDIKKIERVIKKFLQ